MASRVWTRTKQSTITQKAPDHQNEIARPIRTAGGMKVSISLLFSREVQVGIPVITQTADVNVPACMPRVGNTIKKLPFLELELKIIALALHVYTYDKYV